MAALVRSRRERGCTVLAAVLGLGVGWLDIHTTEVIVTIVPLLAGGLLCGILEPRGPWRWGVVMALGLPIVAALARLAGVVTAEPVRLDPRVWLVAAAFALSGCYAGALLRRAFGAIGREGSAP